MCSSITGWPGRAVENVTLTNIRISTTGGTLASEFPVTVPECEGDYPENRMFGFTLPASGLWARHVTGLVVENAEFGVRNPDARPDVVLQDVSGAELSRFRNETGPDAVTLRTDSCRWISCDRSLVLLH